MTMSLSTSERPSNTRFPGPIRAHNLNGSSIASAVFAQTTAECPYTLQWDATFPRENCPLLWGIWTLGLGRFKTETESALLGESNGNRNFGSNGGPGQF